MSKSSETNAFLIHLGAYVLVNAALLYLNASTPAAEGEAREWWAIYPLLGWGIGVAAHGLGVWSKRHQSDAGLMSDPDARGVAIHLFVYLAVNAFLIAINILKTPDSIWAIWPVLGWGAGLAAHAWLAYRAITQRTVERYAKEQHILSEMQLEKQAAQIAEAITEPFKDEKPAARKRRKQATKQTTKRAAARRGTATKRTTRKKPAAKTSASKAKTTTRKKPAAKKPAAKKRSRKPATSSRRKST